MYKNDLYRGCYIAKNVQIGDELPITAPVFDEQGREQLKPDVCILDDSVQPLLESLHKIYNQINTEKYKKAYEDYFSNQNIDISVDLFFPCLSVLIARKKALADVFADEDRSSERARKYITRKKRYFTEILSDKEVACGEYAAVAQLFFQSLGLNSEIFCGMRFTPAKGGGPEQDADPHTFLILKDKNHQRYVFDEMLDRKIGKEIYPVIRKIPLDDDEWHDFLDKTRPQYEGGNLGVFPTIDIFNKHVLYYGAALQYVKSWSEKNIWRGKDKDHFDRHLKKLNGVLKGTSDTKSLQKMR